MLNPRLRNTLRTLTVAAAFVAASALPAQAQSFGLNVQYGQNVESLQAGVELLIPTPTKYVKLMPNVEGYMPRVGWGVSVSQDVLFSAMPDHAVSPFVGGGVSYTRRVIADMDRSGTGANALGGIRFRVSEYLRPFVQVEYRTGVWEDVSYGVGVRSSL